MDMKRPVKSRAAKAGAPPEKAKRALKTVSVPAQFQPIFDKAQDYVARYFAEREEDPERSTIRISGERYILVRAASMSVEFVDLVVSLYKDRGEEEARSLANNLLFDIAHAIGKADARAFIEKMKVTDPIDKLSAGPVHFSYAGWAYVDILPESLPVPNDSYYLIYNHPFSFESDAWIQHKRKTDLPVCIMNAGYSSGWCEESFGLPLVSVEVECRAMGDEQCRFIMSPPARIDEHVEEYQSKSNSTIQARTKRAAAKSVSIPEFFQRKRMEDELRRTNSELQERVQERASEVRLAIAEREREATERAAAEKLQSALFRIAHQTTAAQDLKELYGNIHGIISELMYARNMYIALYEPETDMVSFPYYIDDMDMGAAHPPRKKRHGITEYVLRSGEPLLATPDVLEEMEESGEVERIGTPSLDWMGVPLKRGNATYGVLALQTYEENIRYGEKEKEILVFVSQQIASAIESKQREEALRKSEERYRTLFESAAYGVFRSTLEGKFLDVNPALVNMLGYSSVNEVMALDINSDVFVDVTERLQILRHFEKEHAILNVDSHWKRKDGSIIIVRATGRTNLDADSNVSGFEVIVEDITERRALEERLRQAQKMEAIGRLAGGVAHDFNNLLTVIQGYSELMLQDPASISHFTNEVTEIKKAADRAATLTSQLLAFSRQQVMVPRILDLNQIIGSLDSLIKRLLGEGNTLKVKLSPKLGNIRADASQLEQVIMNLAVNSRDALNGNGTFTLETSNEILDEVFASENVGAIPGEYVTLTVTDNGQGMDAETRSRIFEPFFTTKPAGKGTGLGLATVYGIVKQSEGYIHVYSELGQGTTIRIYFPRVHEKPESISTGAIEIAPKKGNETVFVVEDEDGVRAIVQNVLSRNGYHVLTAADAQSALDQFRSHDGTIHLLLTDIALKHINGRQLSQQFRTLRPDMRVVLMSGYTDDAAVHQGVLNQDADFLQKPFNSHELLKIVRQVLDRN